MLSFYVQAAPEWQASSLGWRSREIMVACPLEGLVRQLITEENYMDHVYNCLGVS